MKNIQTVDCFELGSSHFWALKLQVFISQRVALPKNSIEFYQGVNGVIRLCQIMLYNELKLHTILHRNEKNLAIFLDKKMGCATWGYLQIF